MSGVAVGPAPTTRRRRTGVTDIDTLQTQPLPPIARPARTVAAGAHLNDLDAKERNVRLPRRNQLRLPRGSLLRNERK